MFLVDGFNLYHSLRDASVERGRVSTKWLDLRSLCASYLSAIGGGAALEAVFYFSALALYKLATDPTVPDRHRTYIECLRDTGVDVQLAKFKAKKRWCRGCKSYQTHHEEKETDVAIGVKLVEVLCRDLCEVAVLVTGDSDLAPAVRCAKSMCPGKRVCLISPYKRIGHELESLVDSSFRVKPDRYIAHQLPNPFPTKDGRTLPRPASW